MTSIPASTLVASPVPSGPQARPLRRLPRPHPSRPVPPQPPGRVVALDADRQAQYAATAQTLGVSLSAARALLAILLGDGAPSVAGLATECGGGRARGRHGVASGRSHWHSRRLMWLGSPASRRPAQGSMACQAVNPESVHSLPLPPGWQSMWHETRVGRQGRTTAVSEGCQRIGSTRHRPERRGPQRRRPCRWRSLSPSGRDERPCTQWVRYRGRSDLCGLAEVGRTEARSC
jgi:hypothetical protein